MCPIDHGPATQVTDEFLRVPEISNWHTAFVAGIARPSSEESRCGVTQRRLKVEGDFQTRRKNKDAWPIPVEQALFRQKCMVMSGPRSTASSFPSSYGDSSTYCEVNSSLSSQHHVSGYDMQNTMLTNGKVTIRWGGPQSARAIPQIVKAPLPLMTRFGFADSMRKPTASKFCLITFTQTKHRVASARQTCVEADARAREHEPVSI
jgi:hypothetical protein